MRRYDASWPACGLVANRCGNPCGFSLEPACRALVAAAQPWATRLLSICMRMINMVTSHCAGRRTLRRSLASLSPSCLLCTLPLLNMCGWGFARPLPGLRPYTSHLWETLRRLICGEPLSPRGTAQPLASLYATCAASIAAGLQESAPVPPCIPGNHCMVAHTKGVSRMNADETLSVMQKRRSKIRGHR